MDISDLFKMVQGGGGGKKVQKFTVAKLTPEEVIQFFDLNRRREVFMDYAKQVQSKLDGDAARLWADLRDKYNLHGIPDVTYKESTGELRADIKYQKAKNNTTAPEVPED